MNNTGNSSHLEGRQSIPIDFKTDEVRSIPVNARGAQRGQKSAARTQKSCALWLTITTRLLKLAAVVSIALSCCACALLPADDESPNPGFFWDPYHDWGQWRANRPASSPPVNLRPQPGPWGTSKWTDGHGNYYQRNGSMLRDQNGVNYQKNGSAWTPVR
jgi:hypothetical protein